MHLCKKAVWSAFIFALSLAVLGCKKNNSTEPYVDVRFVTNDATSVTSTSATLSASIIPSAFIEHFRPNMLLSTDPEPSRDITIGYTSSGRYDNGDYYYVYEHLQPGTTYYYRPYAYYERGFSGMESYGEIKSFTTPTL